MTSDLRMTLRVAASTATLSQTLQWESDDQNLLIKLQPFDRTHWLRISDPRFQPQEIAYGLAHAAAFALNGEVIGEVPEWGYPSRSIPPGAVE